MKKRYEEARIFPKTMNAQGQTELRFELRHYQGHTQDHPREPSRVLYDPDGRLSCEEWRVTGARHRESGPAVTYHKPDGMKFHIWYCHGKMVRRAFFPPS